MKIKEYYIENKNKYGSIAAIIRTIQHGVQKIIGTDKYEVLLYKQKEELDTLFYFLDNFVKIEDVAPATGKLRKLQECDILLLQILDTICEQNNIPYFMGWGTLLGAERHKGFIPWDDDTDVCMLREDYDKALAILPDIFTSLGFDVQIDTDVPLASMGIGYKHNRTGIWVDIFPFDCYKWSSINENLEQLRNEIREYRREYLLMRSRGETLENILTKKQKILKGLVEYKDADVVFYNTEFDGAEKIFIKENIFPLKRKKFENIMLNAPNNVEGVLEIMYGRDYMKFPRGGVEHHGNEKNRLSNWASISGTDMDTIKCELENVLKKLNDRK